MKRYYYTGPVCEYGKVVQENWYGETVAPSEKKAKSNLIFQWKKRYGRAVGSKVTLPGELDWEV